MVHRLPDGALDMETGMSAPAYRVEREGTTFRVLVLVQDRWGRPIWGQVQSGLTQDAANDLCDTLRRNEESKRA